MGSSVEIGKTSDLADGTMKAVSVEGHEILLARVGDKYYAADQRCPHLGGKLSEGQLESTVVTCPLHGSQFDLSSGKVVRWLKGTGLLAKIGTTLKQPKPLPVYETKINGDRIIIDI